MVRGAEAVANGLYLEVWNKVERAESRGESYFNIGKILTIRILFYSCIEASER